MVDNVSDVGLRVLYNLVYFPAHSLRICAALMKSSEKGRSFNYLGMAAQSDRIKRVASLPMKANNK
jgi:hypothetical protein